MNNTTTAVHPNVNAISHSVIWRMAHSMLVIIITDVWREPKVNDSLTQTSTKRTIMISDIRPIGIPSWKKIYLQNTNREVYAAITTCTWYFSLLPLAWISHLLGSFRSHCTGYPECSVRMLRLYSAGKSWGLCAEITRYTGSLWSVPKTLARLVKPLSTQRLWTCLSIFQRCLW